MHELSEEAQIETSRDVSEIGIESLQGMLFAPSADRTDDPSQHDLYLIDGQTPGTSELPQREMRNGPASNDQVSNPGRLIEASLLEAPAAAAAEFVSTLIQTTDTSEFTPPSPDAAGLAYINLSATLLLSDSEVNEMPIFSEDNLFEMTASGNLIGTATTTTFSDEPTGVAYSPGNNHVFISDDDGDEIYEIALGPDGKYGTPDDTVTSFDTRMFNSSDPEGITFDTWRSVLFIVDGENAEVYEVNPGTNGVFDGVPPTGDDQVTSFDTLSHGIEDPEGIVFNKDTGNLYVVGQSDYILAEFTTSGAPVQMIDISAANADNPAGLAYAPGSLNQGVDNIFIAERGVDNDFDPDENDGKVYEMTLPPGPSVPHPPVANDDYVSMLLNKTVIIEATANDMDPNGNLDRTSTNTACPICADPFNGSLTNNGNGSFDYIPNSGFSGSDNFFYEICDAVGACDTATVTVIVLSQQFIPIMYASSSSDGDVGGIVFNDEDILAYDRTFQTWSMYFDLNVVITRRSLIF